MDDVAKIMNSFQTNGVCGGQDVVCPVQRYSDEYHRCKGAKDAGSSIVGRAHLHFIGVLVKREERREKEARI